MNQEIILLINESIKSLKDNGIEYPRTEENKSFEVFIQKITNPNIVRIANKLTKNLKIATNSNINIKDRVILSAYMIIDNYEEVLSGCTSENIVIMSAKNLCLSIENILTCQNLTMTELNRIVENYSTFENNLNEWKKDDSVRLAHTLAKTYNELLFTRNRLQEQIDNNDEAHDADIIWRDELGKQMNVIHNKLQLIKKDNWQEYIDLYNPENMNVIDPDNIINTMRKAFWDKQNQELEENPPNFDSALKSFSELTDLIKIFAITESDRNEISEVLDIEYIRQRIIHQCFTLDYLMSIVRYCIRWIRKLEAPQHDKDTDEWLIELTEASAQNKPISTILTQMFFPKAFDKMEEIIQTILAIQNYEQKKADEAAESPASKSSS